MPNKITADVKQAILEAFSAHGGVEYLKRVAITDPKSFCALLGKIVPVKVESEDSPPMIKATIDRPPEEKREKAIKRAVAERLRADPEWLNKERERRRKRHKERRKDREYRRDRVQTRRRWRMRKRQALAHARDDG